MTMIHYQPPASHGQFWAKMCSMIKNKIKLNCDMQASSAIYYHKPISRTTLIYFLLPLKMPQHVNFTISLIIFFFIIRE